MEMCSDGVHAVRRMGERTFDLVLMDIFMPQMDGQLLLNVSENTMLVFVDLPEGRGTEVCLFVCRSFGH